jgi:hypothetical protein
VRPGVGGGRKNCKARAKAGYPQDSIVETRNDIHLREAAQLLWIRRDIKSFSALNWEQIIQAVRRNQRADGGSARFMDRSQNRLCVHDCPLTV